jgi:hypothetical protein
MLSFKVEDREGLMNNVPVNIKRIVFDQNWNKENPVEKKCRNVW